MLGSSVDRARFASNLKTSIAGIMMKAPVLIGSGAYGFGDQPSDCSKIGAFVTKGLTLERCIGNCSHVYSRLPHGNMLNSVGLKNPGVRDFIKDILPKLSEEGVPIIANICGGTIEEYAELAKLLDTPRSVAGLEVNISCPNVAAGGMAFGVSPEIGARVVEAVKKSSRKPMIVKLTPNVTDITKIARAVEIAGADAISLINTLQGMDVDIESGRSTLDPVFGGLSGPAIQPISLRMVYQVRKAVKIPLIGMGGITTTEDALKFFMVGADAVAICSALYNDPSVAGKVVDGLFAYMEQKGIKSLEEIKGAALNQE
ncbi:MAG: dihydroorotate dehydrogenase [Holosporaceae bacterium]|jgi:dihydroorotate dehydrogenase (NAD+) catalytic subunit|nr:dihydroorotate dehydrogenase [Holosporaceae bacterium]